MYFKQKKKSPYPVINTLECKACERCTLACRAGVLKMSNDINPRGYHYVVYEGEGCTGCGDCYYTCPEPLAIEVHVLKRAKRTGTNGNGPKKKVSEDKGPKHHEEEN